MERKCYYERENEFTYDERKAISEKSDYKCCHCGKEVYIGYGATIDHFIPLYRGGSNRNINLIMLCKDCNKEKDDKIVNLTYIPYLKDKYKNEISGYLESYIKSFDYISRQRIFACDEYRVNLVSNICTNMVRKGKKPYKMLGTKYNIKAATYNDLNKLFDYFEKYAKKYNKYDSRKTIEANIIFWMKFGSIYYLEKNGEIALMIVFTIKHLMKNECNYEITHTLKMYVFSYYSNENAFSLVNNTIEAFSEYIMLEQNLEFLPLMVVMLENDKLLHRVSHYITGHSPKENTIPWLKSIPLMIFSKDESKTKDGELEEKTNSFFKKFNCIDQKVYLYYKKMTDKNLIDWMMYDIFSPLDIKEQNIFSNDEDRFLNEMNEQLLEDYALESCNNAVDIAN